MPEWLTGDILDVRMSVMQWLNTPPTHSATASGSSVRVCHVSFVLFRHSLIYPIAPLQPWLIYPLRHTCF